MQSISAHITHRLRRDAPFSLQLRQLHIEPGPREKALLEGDPALKKFKSHKKSIYRLQRFGDVLSIVVLTGCCYEIMYRTMKKKAERDQQQAASE